MGIISDLWQVFSQWGPLFGLVTVALIFFLWKDWKRENRLQDRVETLEEDQKNIILPMLEKCTTVIVQNTEMMTRVESMISRCIFACKYDQQINSDAIREHLREATK